MPESVWMPPAIVSPPPAPASSITPAKVVEPLLMVSVWVPSVTPPAPDSVVIAVPVPDVPEISKVPSAATPLESLMLPLPESARVPAVIVVRPV